ncbi:hypothetical protein F4604DRAFT_1684216 [Suillus subluteus]|nr:hypothetical protein F4604DRAFT_1684216 [Suillus subluteus]
MTFSEKLLACRPLVSQSLASSASRLVKGRSDHRSSSSPEISNITGRLAVRKPARVYIDQGELENIPSTTKVLKCEGHYATHSEQCSQTVVADLRVIARTAGNCGLHMALEQGQRPKPRASQTS